MIGPGTGSLGYAHRRTGSDTGGGGFREDSSSYDSYACYGSGAHAGGSAAGGWDAFQFLAESGNIAANITMYGMVKA